MASQQIGTVVIAGPPASGKSTQCKLLLEKYGLTHISAGDLLRARQKLIPELSKYMQNGLLVPDELVCSIVKERLSEKDCRGKVLLDGFPRTRRQAEVLQEMGVKVSHFILMQVPNSVVIGRVAGRRLDPVSGEVYHIESNPPKKEEVLARLITREDDTEEKMHQRLEIYHANIKAISYFYRKQLRPVNANLHPDAVFDQIRRNLEGDMYWGCMINRTATVRSYETSGAFDIGGSLDMISISRYFDHMSWLMRTRGVLADRKVEAVRFVDRAHSSEVKSILVPGLDLSLSVWLKSVGESSVTLGCAIWARYSDLTDALRFANRFVDGQYYTAALGNILEEMTGSSSEVKDGYVEIAKGSTTLVAINARTGKPTMVPFRRRLKNLVARGDEIQSMLTGKQPRKNLNKNKISKFKSLVDVDPLHMNMEEPSLESFETDWLVQPKDVSVDGTVSTATCVGYLETSRFAATSSSGYGSVNDNVRHFSGLQASSVSVGASDNLTGASKPRSVWMETFAPVRIGDHVKMKTWILRKPIGVLKQATEAGYECVGFHLYNESMGDMLVLRGCEIVKTPEFKSKM
mmetsp:Transcript_14459/g.17873  ORF Transcript_14459/g.17873 Transcript_14459/m.17873 type:complete len:576 (-) Transcript_14459:1422-3149(-)